MAVINRLRNSKWVFVVVLVSLALFVASDFFSSSSKFSMGGDEAFVGEIDGVKIKQVDFDTRYRAFLQQNGQNSNDDQIKEQSSSYAWNQIIQELVINKEYEKAGISLSEQEISDLLYSQDAHSLIKQYFSTNGQFSPSNVIQFKKNAKNNPQAMEGFKMLLAQINLQVKSDRYNALLKNTYYATSLDYEDDFYSNRKSHNGQSVTLNFASIDDNTIKITDDELNAYIKKHKEDFKQEASRDIEYALFDIRATLEDTNTIRQEVLSEQSAFKNAVDDSLYISVSGSSVPFDTLYHHRGEFNLSISNEKQLFNTPKDSILGPILYEGGFSLFKVVDKKQDSNTYYHVIRAEIPVRGVTKADTTDAMAVGRKMIAEANSQSDAMEFYNSKTVTGEISSVEDMRWMKMGVGIPEIEKAVKTLSVGQSTVVKSVYGLSIIKLVDPKSNETIQVAEMRKEIEPLKSTTDAVYQKANSFRGSLTTEKNDFDNKTKQIKIAKSVANNVKESDKTMTGLSNTKDVIRWAYAEETEVGSYSDILDCGSYYIVARLAKIKEDGTAALEDVRDKVTAAVMNEKKAEILKGQINDALKTAKNINDVALAVKSIAQPFNNITMSSNSIPFAGNDPLLVGYLCGIPEKKLSQAIVSKEGVTVLYVESTEAPQIPVDTKFEKDGMYSQERSQVYSNILEALKKAKNVKDERSKYY